MKRLVEGAIEYFYKIPVAKITLWCYLIWYLVVLHFYFDPAPKIWINAIGISAVIGTGLLLSVAPGKSGQASGKTAPGKSASGKPVAGPRDPWQIFRLYLMPFCVSSFSALIKDRGFFIVFSPKIAETGVAVLCCGLFLLVVWVLKVSLRKSY